MHLRGLGPTYRCEFRHGGRRFIHVHLHLLTQRGQLGLDAPGTRVGSVSEVNWLEKPGHCARALVHLVLQPSHQMRAQLSSHFMELLLLMRPVLSFPLKLRRLPSGDIK